MSISTPVTASLADLASRLDPLFPGHDVVRAAIFGSHARGDADPRSDLDLMIVQRTSKRLLDRLAEWLPKVQERIPERDVDLLILTPEELESVRERPFIRRVLEESVAFYSEPNTP